MLCSTGCNWFRLLHFGCQVRTEVVHGVWRLQLILLYCLHALSEGRLGLVSGAICWLNSSVLLQIVDLGLAEIGIRNLALATV